ncbi:MAG: hypothetical protein B0W54_03200 [Cellvibrio sp. 79]|nr:MAG: hypothetical protein B0W54_03200 [Cellvibrio sp. 79]
MLEGHIWHSFNDLDNPEGTFVMNPNTGVSLSVQAEKWGIPWPDGTAFINKEYEPDDAPEDTTRITVYRSNDKAILNDQLIEGYVGYIAPSPTHKDRILAHWGETIFSPRILIVWDLSTQKVLFGIEPGESFDALSWMPDGTLLHVQASGAISKVVIGGDEQLLGTVNWPESRVPQAVYVSPDGTRALVQLAELRDTGTVAWVDLWMMNIDGTEMRRFTNNGLIADAYWSPDSRNVAFVKDTGISCSDSTCMGSCTVWLAPATATEVVAVQASGDAKQFPLQRPNGSMTTLRCPVMAWTL